MRKYVDSSIGQRTPFGHVARTSRRENTAAFSAAKKLSLCGTTEPRYFSHELGMLAHRLAERAEDDAVLRRALPCIVVPTDTESKIASTATPASIFCSVSGMPSFSYVSQQLRIDLVERLPSGFTVFGAE